MMESLQTQTPKKKYWFPYKTITLAISGILAFWSCWKATQQDVLEQQKKVESISFQIEHYIKARKQLVEDYNNLLKYPKNKSNKNDINRSLAQIYEKISEYDEKFEELADDKLEATDKLNEYIWDLEVNYAPNEPIDPDRWDFLLTIQ